MFRPRRAAEQAAAEPRALLVGPVDEDERRAAGSPIRRGGSQRPRRRPSRRARRRASRRSERSRGGSRRRAPAPPARLPAATPRGCRRRRAAARARSRRAARRGTPAPRARSRSSRARCAPRSSPVRRASSRRSAITRAASIPVSCRLSLALRASPGRGSARRRRRRVNAERSGSRSSRPSALICSFSEVAPSPLSTRSSPSEIALTPSVQASASGTSRISNPFSSSQATRPLETTSVHTAATFGATIATSTSMWTKTPGIGSTRASQPSASNQPASWRAAWDSVRSSPAPISATPGSTHDHVAALERAGRDHLPDRDLGALVEADHRRVLAPAPPLLRLRHHRPPGGHHRGVAREHLVGKGGIRVEEVAGDPGRLIQRDELGVLQPRRLRLERPAAVEGRARDRARRQPAEVVGRAEQDVGQPPGLRIGAPRNATFLAIYTLSASRPGVRVNIRSRPSPFSRSCRWRRGRGRRGRSSRRCTRASPG